KLRDPASHWLACTAEELALRAVIEEARASARTAGCRGRRVIHAFNVFGFESLNPKVGTGPPQTFEPAIRGRIVAIALAPPTTLEEPLTHRSLRSILPT